MLTVIREMMCLAVALAIEGNRRQGNQHVTQHQDDVGPLMADDIPLAMIERVGVFRMQTGPVLQRRVDEDHDFPGQPVDAVERLGKLPGLPFREMIQCGDATWACACKSLAKSEGCRPEKRAASVRECFVVA